MPARRRQHGLALRDPTRLPVGAPRELDPQPPHAVRGSAADDGENRRPTRDGSPRGHHAHPRRARAGRREDVVRCEQPGEFLGRRGNRRLAGVGRRGGPSGAAATTTPVRSISRGRSNGRAGRLSDALGRPAVMTISPLRVERLGPRRLGRLVIAEFRRDCKGALICASSSRRASRASRSRSRRSHSPAPLRQGSGGRPQPLRSNC